MGFYRFIVIILLIVSIPLLLAIGFGIVVSSGFPVFFRQKRVGKDGKVFVLYKFRTMGVGAEKKQNKLQALNEAAGPAFKIRNDPRFTAIGKFLSHTGLDELPQLYNILRGDMVFFGPRPLPVSEAKKLKAWMRKRESVFPGIISPAILSGDYHKNFDAWMKSDVAYARSKSIFRDIRLFFQLMPFVAAMFLKELKKTDF